MSFLQKIYHDPTHVNALQFIAAFKTEEKDEAVLSELMKTQKRPNLIKELVRQAEFTNTSHRSR